jgi:hypothetical protein
MKWETNKPKYLSSILIEAGVIISGAVTADLTCIDNQTVIFTGLPLSLIVGTVGTYQLLVDENIYTINRQEYQALYYYDTVPKISEKITLEAFSPNKITNDSMVGIVEDTYTLGGVVEL